MEVKTMEVKTRELANRMLCSMDFDEPLRECVPEMETYLDVTYSEDEIFAAIRLADEEYRAYA